MNRLIQTRVCAQTGGGQHPDGPRQHGRLIAQNVTEQVGRDQHIKLFRVSDELHGTVVHVHMAQLHIRIIAMELVDHPPPELRGLEDIGFVHRRDATPPFASRFECDLGNASDLLGRVDLCIDASLSARNLLDPFRLTEIDSSGQLPHDQQVKPFDDVSPECRCLGKHGVELGGTEIREQTKLLPQPKQGPLGAKTVFQSFPLRPPDRSQQHGGALLRQRKGLLGEWHADLLDGLTTDISRNELEDMPKSFTNRLKQFDSFGHNLTPNPITSQHRKSRFQLLVLPLFSMRAQTRSFLTTPALPRPAASMQDPPDIRTPSC